MAAYMRLSKEDNENMISNSISNQKMLINEYIDKHQDLNLIDYYIDDGYSGTSFNRPAFKRLLEDIRDKIVDGFDSYKNVDGVDDFIVPIKNLINDAYARDISKKVKTALITKKKNGEFVGSYAPYGYCKSKFDKHKFIIDEEASKIVKIIFEKTINGLSKKEIANILNEMKIETPIEHIKNKKENKCWNSNIIYAILKNRIYTRDLIQQKRERLSYKNHKLMMNKEEDFIITKNHHRAIIDIEQFNNVQDIIKHSTKINAKSKYDIFSGYLKCAECNSNLTVKKSKNYMYYTCSLYVL
ncbi:MAG: recombinase family protein [Clostridia bacterium]|nr:recombinase family protein [Clostridia bacterium]